jgi:heme exporter protein CcmD
MGYVVAAYAITIAAVALYFAHLVRERGRLRRELDAPSARAGSSAFHN